MVELGIGYDEIGNRDLELKTKKGGQGTVTGRKQFTGLGVFICLFLVLLFIFLLFYLLLLIQHPKKVLGHKTR